MPEPRPAQDPPTRRPAGGSARTGALTRRHVLQAARRLFLEHGFHATTTRGIAREADVSDALLYRYFPSKRDLFDAVIDEGLAHLEPYVRFGAPALANLRLRETLEAAAYTTVEIIRRDLEVFQLIIAESRLLDGDRRVSVLLEGLHRNLSDRLQDFVDAGEAYPCDTSVLAWQFVGGIAMHDLRHIIVGDRYEPEDTDHFVSEVVDAALRSLEPAPP